jgi:hypothetical protein
VLIHAAVAPVPQQILHGEAVVVLVGALAKAILDEVVGHLPLVAVTS